MLPTHQKSPDLVGSGKKQATVLQFFILKIINTRVAVFYFFAFEFDTETGAGSFVSFYPVGGRISGRTLRIPPIRPNGCPISCGRYPRSPRLPSLQEKIDTINYSRSYSHYFSDFFILVFAELTTTSAICHEEKNIKKSVRL
jgi:hypothetical protein